MAYPQASTYTSETIKFMGGPQQRNSSSNKDQRYVNFFPETIYNGADEKRYALKQRPGLSYVSTVAAGAARGIYYWNSHLYVAIGNKLYKDGTLFQTLGSSSGLVGFTEYQSDVALSLIVLDGNKGWVINASAVINEITDADFPTPHVPTPVFMDGYLFVAKSATADIYNCAVNDPTNWAAGNFITAEMFPDVIVSLTRQANYVVAVGSKTTEFFYDAGNATGSPLSRNTATFQAIGTAAAKTVIQNESLIMMVGQSSVGGRSVWVFKDYQPTEIATEPVRQSLDAEGPNISLATAFCVRSEGHKFYIINLVSRTWVFDFEEGIWHEWAAANGTSRFNCDYVSDYISGYCYTVDRATGIVYNFTDNSSNDELTSGVFTPITSIVITNKIDMGSMTRKFASQLVLICDQLSTAIPITVQWSDDDYATFNTGYTLSLNSAFINLQRMGFFRRRAYKFTYAGGVAWRLEGFRLDYNMGIK
jgi:hypothetical protein